MKRVALTPDELDLVLEHRRKKTVYNEALVHIEHALLARVNAAGFVDGVTVSAIISAVIAEEKVK